MSNEELVSRIKAGNDTAGSMEQLWQQVRDYVAKFSRKYEGEAENEDLMQEGFLALYDAVAGYDEESGFKFLTYATFWINQRMVRYVQNNGCIRVPAYKGEELREYKRIVNHYMLMHGRKPNRQEVSQCMGISVEAVEDIEKAALSKKTRSLEGYFYTEEGEEDNSIERLLVSQNNIENDVVEKIQREEQRKTVWKVVDTLAAEQKKVVRVRYQGNKTRKETAEILGLSEAKIISLEQKAFRELRRPYNVRILRPLFTDAIIYSMGVRGTGVQQFQNTWTSSTERVALKI
ncbi:MAG: sigma-70 family RNA polymerase sigma factor, partial [Lachnospiraceae bacterium]|nr:sigma-70 family RNA polymerase sigma factor [Lachnospiraceae bacterium]